MSGLDINVTADIFFYELCPCRTWVVMDFLSFPYLSWSSICPVGVKFSKPHFFCPKDFCCFPLCILSFSLRLHCCFLPPLTSMASSSAFCRTTLILLPVFPLSMKRVSSVHWHIRVWITHSILFFASYEIFLFLFHLLSFRNASFTTQMQQTSRRTNTFQRVGQDSLLSSFLI